MKQMMFEGDFMMNVVDYEYNEKISKFFWT